jgi:hypothetical protein
MTAKKRAITTSIFLIACDSSENPLAGQAASGITHQQIYQRHYLKRSMVTFSAVASVPFNFSESFVALKVPEKLTWLLPDVT